MTRGHGDSFGTGFSGVVPDYPLNVSNGLASESAFIGHQILDIGQISCEIGQISFG